MEKFKLSKTGIIIIVISIVIVLLLVFMLYIAGKKQQEIDKKQAELEAETEVENPEPIQQNAIGNDDEKYHQLFEDYRAGKYTSKEAIAQSGLSTGMFYKKLNKYENKG